ncbi:O-methyltransferase [Marinoscillum furvescens]|uniref:Putative O-methyltransferase YrrM n=1 Tax=Marinoscillum furvescens DSM 4134 TaxID=1122208 RepID=A0A3D9LJG4_MARFU|nr:O-methyltransferase [Marinoscillum furvescens]REE05796.1 putative O-methyltransferase YrrM [Marinoscillum furvescens DSM 4134]
MDFLPAELDQYVAAHTAPEPELLRQISRETHLEVLKPRMLSGHLQGRTLAMLAHMVQPKYILEIGTYTGYSALCLAEGLTSGGQLVTIDVNEELERRVKNYFAQSPYRDQIELRIGNAQEIIPTLSYTWDMVFIDADKQSYSRYFELTLPQVRKGGFIIIDNVLWSGKVFDESKSDKATLSMRAFNQMVHDHPDVENVLLPIRDGLMVLRKL